LSAELPDVTEMAVPLDPIPCLDFEAADDADLLEACKLFECAEPESAAERWDAFPGPEAWCGVSVGTRCSRSAARRRTCWRRWLGGAMQASGPGSWRR
jgi:hypothetical protein